MAYIGNTVQNQGFTPAIDYFSGNGSTVTFTLSRPVASVAQMIVAVDNVIQNPASAYTVSGSSITFTSAPLAGTNNIWVEYTSLITTYAALSQSPSVVGDITASGGYLATGSFGASFVDGTIVDYVTGNARITAGPADGITLYNGGTSARSALMTLDSSGNMGVGTTSPTQKLDVRGNIFTTNAAIFGGNISAPTADASVYRTADNTLAFATASTERMRIDSSGNIQVNQANDVAKLNVKTSSAVAYNASGYNGTGNNLRLTAGGTPTTGTTAGIAFGMGGSAESYIGGVQNASGYSDIAFQTYNGSYSEKMRLTSGGVLLLNETSTAQSPLMQITGSGQQYNLLTIKDTYTSYSTGNRIVMFLNSSDAIAGVISHSGVTSVTYGTSSDQRLKENIVDAPDALDKVMNIKVRSYDWKEDSFHVEYGFVAQEINEVYGEPVGVGGEDVKSDPWNIEYGRLTPILLKAIQEQQDIIKALTARIEALEAK